MKVWMINEALRKKSPYDRKTTVWVYGWMLEECSRLGLSVSAICREAINDAIQKSRASKTNIS